MLTPVSRPAKGIKEMHSRLFGALQIMLPVLAYHGLILFAGYQFLTDYCSDRIPATDSIYVYTVDRAFDELNRKYAAAKGIKPEDETRLITYDDIPEISTWEGVKDVYVFDDAAYSEYEELQKRDDVTFNVAVPADSAVHYGDPSGMRSLFSLYYVGTLDVFEYEYIVFECHHGSHCNVYDDPDLYLYYKYDPATWELFTDRLDEYLEDEDAVSYVSMLITVDGDSEGLQQRLMSEYPASNYSSADFTSTWRNAHNNKLLKRIVITAVTVIVIVVALEILLGKLRKKANLQKKCQNTDILK